MMLGLTASGIRKSYNGNEVLKECSFSFREQGLYILTGPNGCGKSTFLRICALIEAPDSGEVNYFSNGKQLPKDLELKRRITLVLPKVGVFNTTVFKNVAYGLTIRGIERTEAEERVNEMLDFVQLVNRKNQNALSLSSGETQRLGIARALVIKPEILFLDEPTASVDQKNEEIIEGLILKMRTDGRATVVITTHDREQAVRLSGSLLVMKDGKIT
ncbi:MAG TPA: ATP-binding cassette domain-containing protein [Thermodesulfovibrionales bacterium]|nr:ATP-binding cassette domain-containing protein [Thermodesulfovibrionales bacterium]